MWQYRCQHILSNPRDSPDTCTLSRIDKSILKQSIISSLFIQPQLFFGTGSPRNLCLGLILTPSKKGSARSNIGPHIFFLTLRAFVVFSNGKNGTIGRQIPFKVLPMVPLVIYHWYQWYQCYQHTAANAADRLQRGQFYQRGKSHVIQYHVILKIYNEFHK